MGVLVKGLCKDCKYSTQHLKLGSGQNFTSKDRVIICDSCKEAFVVDREMEKCPTCAQPVRTLDRDYMEKKIYDKETHRTKCPKCGGSLVFDAIGKWD